MNAFLFRLLITITFVFSATEKIMAETKNYPAAIANLESQLKVKPKDVKLHFKLGQAYYHTKSWDNALAHFKKANNPTNVEALEWIAKTCEQQKNYLEVIRALELLVQKQPNIPKYYTQLGAEYLKIEKMDKAIENYKEAIKRAPKYEKAYEELLAVYTSHKNFYEADILLGDIVSTFGETEKWLSKMCEVKTLQNYYEDSKVICQRAIEKGPRVPENHIYMGLSYKYTGSDQQASKIILKAGRRFKKSELAQFYAGVFSDEIKDWEHAAMFYLQGTKIDAKSTRCFLGGAKSMFELNKFEKSLAAFTRACSLDNNVDNEIRLYAGKLRSKKQNAWYTKFKNQVDKCGVLRSKIAKTIAK